MLGNMKLSLFEHSDLHNDSFFWFNLIFSTTDGIPIYVDGLGGRFVCEGNSRIPLWEGTLFSLGKSLHGHLQKMTDGRKLEGAKIALLNQIMTFSSLFLFCSVLFCCLKQEFHFLCQRREKALQAGPGTAAAVGWGDAPEAPCTDRLLNGGNGIPPEHQRPWDLS